MSNENIQPTSGRSHIVSLLLALFTGWLGIHRFYTGYILIGVIQLLTVGGFGIWQLIDIISISIGEYRDADGNKLENYNTGCGMIALIIVLVTFLVGGINSVLSLLTKFHG